MTSIASRSPTNPQAKVAWSPKLEERLTTKVLLLVAQKAKFEPDRADAATADDVRRTIVTALRSAMSDGPINDRRLVAIAESVLTHHPVIAQPLAPNTRGTTVRSESARTSQSLLHAALLDSTTRSALLFPPLQGYSPRSRRLILPHPPAAKNSDDSKSTRVLEDATSAARLRSTGARGPIPPYAVDAEEEESAGSLPHNNKTAAPSSHHLETPPPVAVVADTLNAPSSATSMVADITSTTNTTSGAAQRAVRSSPRKPKDDVWTKLVLLDAQRYRTEQQTKRDAKREQQARYREILEGQLAAKSTTARLSHVSEEEAQRKADSAAALLEEHRRQDELARAQRADDARRAIEQQLAERRQRREAERAHESAEKARLRIEFEKAVAAEQQSQASKRGEQLQTRLELQRFKEHADREKANLKVREAEADAKALLEMEHKARVLEARRAEHLVKVSQKAHAARTVALSLQQSEAVKARAEAARIERDAAKAEEGAQRRDVENSVKRQLATLEAQAHLEAQLTARRQAALRDAQNDAAEAEAIRRAEAALREKRAQEAAHRRRAMEAYRQEVVNQIAERDSREAQPVLMTAAERSMNKRLLCELQEKGD